jgi:hypothetical protein
MKKLLFVLAFIVFFALDSYSQYYIGIKGGMGLNMQTWNNYERDILFSPCIDIFSETNDDELNKLYISGGFHTRGSSVRSFGFGFNSSRPYKFNNLSLEVGGKRMVTTTKKYNGYYMLGLRAEYTISTNLEGTTNTSIYNLVDDVYVRRFNYGVSVGGGFELEIAKDKVIFFEVVVQPDLSKQYEQLETLTIKNPNPIPGGPFPSPEFVTIVPQEVRNVAIELKIGIKLLRAYLEDDEY